MKKLLLGISLLAALFAGSLMAEETNGWVWVGTDWVYTGSTDGGDPIPPPPPPPIRL